MMRRLATICHLWPGVRPHRSGVEGSIWDLEWHTFIVLAANADDYARSAKEAENAR